MNCELARQLVVFNRPGATELEASDIAALESHLADCEECRARASAEQAWDDKVSQAIQAIAPPADGAARVVARLKHDRWVVRGWQAAKLAVACVTITGGWYLWPAPQLDAMAMAEAAYVQVGNREGVAEWLTRQNSKFGFPPRFSGKYLVSCERRGFYGVTAPVLTFVRHDAQARVAVVTKDQFRNLKDLPDGRLADNSVCTIIVVRDPETPDVVYIIEVINGQVEPFYNDGEASVT